MTAIAVTIAGSDSGGGAGIQADLKTFSALGVYGASVLTALTAQNTLGVQAIHDVPAEFIRQQMESVYSDLRVNATKIGMLSQPAAIEAVAASGRAFFADQAVVLDPVMVAASGDPLIADEAVAVMKSALFPLATLITPNLHEAARLLETDPAADQDQMEDQARQLMALSGSAVLLKGGHYQSDLASDCLVIGSDTHWFSGPRVETSNTHGTGCTLSSAIAAGFAKGLDLLTSVEQAKTYISQAIAHADDLAVGRGSGPVHHFKTLWKEKV